jgi:hypothetical protein
MGEMSTAYISLIEKPEEKLPHGTHGLIWEINIKENMKLREE